MSKEMMKTIAIFILCGLAGLMLQGLWFNDIITIDRSDKLSSVQTREDVAYLLSPKAINVSFGGGEMTTFFFDKDGMFDGFKDQLKQGLQDIQKATVIETDAYFSLRLKRSIEFELTSEFETKYILALLTNEIHSSPKQPTTLSKVLVVARETMHIYVESNGLYYDLELSKPLSDINNVVDQQEALGNTLPFSTVDSRFDLNPEALGEAYISKQILVPKFSLEAISPVRVKQSISPSQVEEVRVLAGNVFGSRLNFVQEAVDINQGLVLLYGYGDKALHVSQEGKLEYSERIAEQNKYERHILKDLNRALHMIVLLGGEPKDLFIKSIIPIDQGDSKGYKFEFGYRFDNYMVYSKEGHLGINVEVFGDKIRSFSRNTWIYQGSKMLTTDEASIISDDDAQFFNMLNKPETFEVISNQYMNDQGIDTSSLSPILSYQKVLGGITGFDVGLFEVEGDELRPVVVLAVGKRTYYIDFYTYELLLAQ